ncbi:MAG TPA: thymidine kinase [Firmicutes bacterium]|jgi:thymidine kinase|nr:thymidine kinase [Bacillota bacterium]
MSKLYFRYGAMNCGKTTSLLQVAHNYEERGMKVVLIKPSIDTKANDSVSSRIGVERKVDHLVSPEENLKGYLNLLVGNTSCVLVDEAQFLSESQVEELFVFSKLTNIPVICFGLRCDFRTNLFPGSKRLFELADEIEELYTICRCGRKARFNARIVNGEFTLDGDQVAIDGDVEYESLCGKCYLTKVRKMKGWN